ncbi:MAG TPA: hypothetical protein VGG27_03715 [Magnetospirillaceae bacterium]
MTVLGLQDRSNSFILNLGDEGATLVQIRAGQVVDAVFAEAAVEDGWDAIREMLQTDPTARVIVVADVLEQMFREDTVPKVGILDRGKIVKRRLDLTFPNDLLKAALPLPRTRGAAQSVLFTALPTSPHLERWIAFLNEFSNPLSGFYMLPLEVVGLADRLAPSAQGETRRVWRALISQEAASGFRQVFESGGRLVVTRLTQRPTQPLTPEAEAMLIERELRSSISYIKRLGFSDADRLDVVVLADPAVCRSVGERDLPATTITVNTPYQAGVLLDLGEVGRDDSPFADVLLGLWVARKRRPTMTLPTPRIAQQMRMTQVMRWSAIGAAALTLLAIFYVGSLISDYIDGGDTISSLEAQLKSAKTDLDTENARVKGYPIPLDELTQVATTEQALTKDELDMGATVRKIGAALANDGRVTRISYEMLAQPAAGQRGKKPAIDNGKIPSGVTYEIHIVVKFDPPGVPTPDSDAATSRAKAILNRLVAAFADSQVQALHLPSDLQVNQIIEGNASGTTTDTQQAASPVLTAEYVIRMET